jgi:hypothetical protein
MLDSQSSSVQSRTAAAIRSKAASKFRPRLSTQMDVIRPDTTPGADRYCQRPGHETAQQLDGVALRRDEVEDEPVRSCLGSRHLPVRRLRYPAPGHPGPRSARPEARPPRARHRGAPRSRPRTVAPPRHRGALARAPCHPLRPAACRLGTCNSIASAASLWLTVIPTDQRSGVRRSSRTPAGRWVDYLNTPG